MYILVRPINGISLNGNEVLLNEDGSYKTFDTEEEAVFFIMQNYPGDESISIESADNYDLSK